MFFNFSLNLDLYLRFWLLFNLFHESFSLGVLNADLAILGHCFNLHTGNFLLSFGCLHSNLMPTYHFLLLLTRKVRFDTGNWFFFNLLGFSLTILLFSRSSEGLMPKVVEAVWANISSRSFCCFKSVIGKKESYTKQYSRQLSWGWL